MTGLGYPENELTHSLVEKVHEEVWKSSTSVQYSTQLIDELHEKTERFPTEPQEGIRWANNREDYQTAVKQFKDKHPQLQRATYNLAALTQALRSAEITQQTGILHTISQYFKGKQSRTDTTQNNIEKPFPIKEIRHAYEPNAATAMQKRGLPEEAIPPQAHHNEHEIQTYSNGERDTLERLQTVYEDIVTAAQTVRQLFQSYANAVTTEATATPVQEKAEQTRTAGIAAYKQGKEHIKTACITLEHNGKFPTEGSL